MSRTKQSISENEEVTPKKTKQSPYTIYGAYKLEKAGVKDGKIIFKSAEKPFKTVKLLVEQFEELNVHKENTLIEYKEM